MADAMAEMANRIRAVAAYAERIGTIANINIAAMEMAGFEMEDASLNIINRIVAAQRLRKAV